MTERERLWETCNAYGSSSKIEGKDRPAGPKRLHFGVFLQNWWWVARALTIAKNASAGTRGVLLSALLRGRGSS